MKRRFLLIESCCSGILCFPRPSLSLFPSEQEYRASGKDPLPLLSRNDLASTPEVAPFHPAVRYFKLFSFLFLLYTFSSNLWSVATPTYTTHLRSAILHWSRTGLLIPLLSLLTPRTPSDSTQHGREDATLERGAALQHGRLGGRRRRAGVDWR